MCVWFVGGMCVTAWIENSQYTVCHRLNRLRMDVRISTNVRITIIFYLYSTHSQQRLPLRHIDEHPKIGIQCHPESKCVDVNWQFQWTQSLFVKSIFMFTLDTRHQLHLRIHLNRKSHIHFRPTWIFESWISLILKKCYRDRATTLVNQTQFIWCVPFNQIRSHANRHRHRWRNTRIRTNA